MFKWVLGRQYTGYYKLCFFNIKWPFKIDGYLIRYPRGCAIGWHKDEVPGYSHHRINFIIKTGGVYMETFDENKKWKLHKSRIVIFRPDKLMHSINMTKSSRYAISIGWAIKNAV